MREELVLSLIDLEDVSVSRESEDCLRVTCKGHDGADTIEIEDVHDLIGDADGWVASTIVDFDAGVVELEVVV